MTARQIILIMRAMLVLLWVPTSAWAAQITLHQTLDGLTAASLAIVFALSSLSGATALVLRIEKELRASTDGKLPRPWLFASAHMLGSWLASVLALFVGEAQDMNDWLVLGMIVCAGFGGAKFIEMVAEKYLSKILPPTPGNTP